MSRLIARTPQQRAQIALAVRPCSGYGAAILPQMTADDRGARSGKARSLVGADQEVATAPHANGFEIECRNRRAWPRLTA